MPFTPFHFGPGLLLKGIAPKNFSWTAFAAAQVVIDCETLYHIVRHEYPLHRELHTFIGATAAGLATAGALIALKKLFPGSSNHFARLSALLRSEAATIPILVGGIIGGASHPLLDGIMHADIRPFMPWSDANPLLGLIGLGWLHLACVLAGIAGIALLLSRRA